MKKEWHETSAYNIQPVVVTHYVIFFIIQSISFDSVCFTPWLLVVTYYYLRFEQSEEKWEEVEKKTASRSQRARREDKKWERALESERKMASAQIPHHKKSTRPLCCRCFHSGGCNAMCVLCRLYIGYNREFAICVCVCVALCYRDEKTDQDRVRNTKSNGKKDARKK